MLPKNHASISNQHSMLASKTRLIFLLNLIQASAETKYSVLSIHINIHSKISLPQNSKFQIKQGDPSQ